MPGGDAAKDSAKDSAKDILNLLELELGAMIRQLERAAASVATGAQSTAATLSAIRQRTDTLTGHTSTAQETAATFSQAADKFSHSADGINGQVREAGKLADQASEAAREAGANVDRLRDSSAAIGNVVNLIATIAKQTTLLALNSTIEAARAGEAVTLFTEKLKSRCAVLLKRDENDWRMRERLPCNRRRPRRA